MFRIAFVIRNYIIVIFVNIVYETRKSYLKCVREIVLNYKATQIIKKRHMKKNKTNK